MKIIEIGGAYVNLHAIKYVKQNGNKLYVELKKGKRLIISYQNEAAAEQMWKWFRAEQTGKPIEAVELTLIEK